MSEGRNGGSRRVRKGLDSSPLHLLKDEGEAVYEQNTLPLTDNHIPVRLPEWLIEPQAEEIKH